MKPTNKYARVAPLTIAVACGPVLDVAEGLGRSGGEMYGVGQVARGVLMLLMIVSIREGRTLTRRSATLLPLFALAFYGAVRASAAGDAYEGAILAMRVLFLALIYLNARELFARGQLTTRWALGSAWVAFLTVVGSQAAGRAMGVSSVYEGSSGLPGLTGQPGTIAASVCALVPLFALRSPLRRLDVAGIALCVASIAATQRRSSTIAVIAALMVFGAFAVRSSTRRTGLRVAGLFIVLGLVGFGLSAWTPLGRELAERFEDLNVREGGTASGRTEFQRIAVAHVLDRDAFDLVLGEGPGALRKVLGQEFGMAIGGHNDWLDIVYAFGLVGVLCFLWFHLNLATMAARLDPQSRDTFMMALAGMVILGATTGGSLDPTAAPTFAAFGILASRREIALRGRPGHAESQARKLLGGATRSHVRGYCGKA